MADFIVEKNEQEARRNPAGVSECLVDPRLRMQRVGLVGLGHVDNTDAIAEDVANQVRPKAIPLDLYYPMDDGVDVSFNTLGYGQCALKLDCGGKASRSVTSVIVTVARL